MPYRFALQEPTQSGFRRIAREQTSKIVSHLVDDAGTPATIHECRKALKRLKSLLKIVRSGTSRKDYAAAYSGVRDISRALSAPRDFDVLPETLSKLLAARPDLQTTLSAPSIEKAILKASTAAASESRDDLIIASRRQTEALSRNLQRLTLKHTAADADFEILVQGVAKGLIRLRAERKRAIKSGLDEDYHNWRKSAQLHWRQLKLISPIWPEMIGSRIRAAKGLAATLGHDHDLAVLAAFVEGLPSQRLAAAHRQVFIEAVQTRQLELRHEARAYARLLVIDKPQTFAQQMTKIHKARSVITGLKTPLCEIFEPILPIHTKPVDS